MVREIKENEFKEVIKEGVVLVDCYASWCGPCKMLSSIIDEVSEEETNVNFYKLDVDNAEDISKEYNIMSIPTLLVFKDGKLVNKGLGLMSKDDIKELIK